MDANEYQAAVEKLTAWNDRDKEYQRLLKANAADRETLLSNRANNKAQYADLLARTQAFEKSHGKTRAPHPDKPNVVVETVAVEVPVVVEVEKPVSWTRALKKVFTGA